MRETSRDESQNVLSTQKLIKREIWSSQFSRDLSQVVRRTPRDTPVPLYTRTSPWPITLVNLPTRVPVCLLNNAKSPIGMTDLIFKRIWGALAIPTVADFKFWRISLVNMSVGMVVAPSRAILRYYRCDAPYRAILFQGG